MKTLLKTVGTLTLLFLSFGCGANHSLELESSLLYKSGDAMPVAKVTFYLLDESAIAIMRKAGIGSEDGKGEREILIELLLSFKSSSAAQFKQEAIKSLDGHIVQQTQTDLQGKARFDQLTPGKYFVFGVAPTRGSGIVWDLPVEVSGESKVALDQSNARFAVR